MSFRIALAAACLLLAGSASGHPMTEQYIPIGQSPGISGQQATIGEILSVDASGRSLLLRDSAGERRLRITASTRLWIDRSLQRQPSEVGRVADLHPGMQVEVRYGDADPDYAYWIKLRP